MQSTLLQNEQKIQNKVCNYDCLIGIETCPEIKGCKVKSKVKEHIKSRYNSHVKKASEKYHIDPPELSDIATLFHTSLNNGFTCKYCGTHLDMFAKGGMINLIPAISLDHIIPLHDKGTNKLYNLQLICHRCNIVKNKIHPDYFDTIVTALKTKYGNEGLIKFEDTLYPLLFVNEIQKNFKRD